MSFTASDKDYCTVSLAFDICAGGRGLVCPDSVKSGFFEDVILGLLLGRI